jgi:AraC-like DNA-binding protein
LALAKRYLAEQSLSASRIAWLLGYTEVSGFSHAFRRWTGRTPRADRRGGRRAASPANAKLRIRARARRNCCVLAQQSNNLSGDRKFLRDG